MVRAVIQSTNRRVYFIEIDEIEDDIENAQILVDEGNVVVYADSINELKEKFPELDFEEVK